MRLWESRIENNYIDTAEQLERQGQQCEKEIELAKFHEERGKINCKCYRCAESKEIRSEIVKERIKIIADYEKEKKKNSDYGTECYNCGEIKKVDSESGLCRKCERKLEDK